MEQKHETLVGLEELVETVNEKLRFAGADSAERAFGIGCLIGLLPTVGVILLMFLFKVINVILTFVLLGLGSLVVLGVAMLLSYQARQNSMTREYHRSVKAEIDQFLSEHELTQQQFLSLLHPILPESAPLTAFLPMENFGKDALDAPEQEESI